MKAKITLSNIIAYLQGTIRYELYYSKNFKWLIPDHIREQIKWRIEVMDRECFEQGQCKMCGCQTTGLQMANKACDKPCYPSIMNKQQWRALGTFYKKTQKSNPAMYKQIMSTKHVGKG